MDNYEKNYLSQHPQSLCNMCGICCRLATTEVPYKKLLELQAQGDEGAMDFLELFEPYASIEEARKVSASVVDNVINGLKADNNYNEDELTFYHCRFIGDDNLCGRYETRKILCDHFPSTPWAIVPPGCGFEGWLFMKREETKQKIRKVKEELIELQLLKRKKLSDEMLAKIEAVEKKMYNSIELHKKHGSEFW